MMKRMNIISSSNQGSQKFACTDTQNSVATRRSFGPSEKGGTASARSSDSGGQPAAPAAAAVGKGQVPGEVPVAVNDAQKKTEEESRLSAGERLQLQYLRQEVKRAQTTVDHLLKVNETALKIREEPLPHCNPRIVTKIANAVVSSLLLEKHIVFPTEDQLKDALLMELGVNPEKDVVPYQEFVKHWSGRVMKTSFHCIMRDAMRRRKGSFTQALREELYVNLGLRKYRRGASLAEKQAFLEDLGKLQIDNMWQAIYVESEYSVDPWGSDAVHAAICRALYGTHYDASRHISMSIDMATFCFHVLTLVMEDRNLQGNERLMLVGELENMERKLEDWEPDMQRISIHPSVNAEPDAEPQF